MTGLLTEHSNPSFSTTHTMLVMFIKTLINFSLFPFIRLQTTGGMEVVVLTNKHEGLLEGQTQGVPSKEVMHSLLSA